MLLTSTHSIFHILAGGMLVLSFFIVARMRLRSLLSFFALQSFFLATFAAAAAEALQEEHLLLTAALTLVLKVLFIPWLLIRTAERGGATHRMSSFLRPSTTLVIGFLMVVVAFVLTNSLVPFADPNYPVVAVSVSMVMLGLLMLVAHKALYGQIVGFLLMESGIFTFGLTLTGGMPLLVEIGIFFDVTIGATLMAALSYRVQQEHEAVITDHLSELVD